MPFEPTIVSVSALSNEAVKNLQDEDLGHIKDVMIDTETAQVAFYVLSFGGVMGMGDKLFAIPPNAIKFDNKREQVVLNIDKERLKEAPGFDKDHWPNMASPSFREEIQSYYGDQRAA